MWVQRRSAYLTTKLTKDTKFRVTGASATASAFRRFEREALQSPAVKPRRFFSNLLVSLVSLVVQPSSLPTTQFTTFSGVAYSLQRGRTSMSLDP